MDINNFVIDRVRRGVMFHSSDKHVLFSINQIENPSMNVTSETSEAVDALGVPIATFNRAKNAELSAESSLFDLGLLAAQSGTTVDRSTSINTYTVPQFDEVKVTVINTLTLTRTPTANSLKYLYKMNGDGTLGMQYSIGDSAAGTVATLSGTTVTFAAGNAAVGDRFFAQYEFTANDVTGNTAARVTGTAVDFPTAGRFILEVLGVDVCNPSTLYTAYIEFPNAKLLTDFDLSFATDSKHPFTLKAMQDYCDPNKVLFRISIPDAAVAA